MKATLKFFFKSFLFAFFIYSIIKFPLDYLGNDFDFEKSLIACLIWAFLLSFTLGIVHLITIKRKGVSNLTAEDFSVYHQKTVESDLTKEDFLKRLERSQWKNSIDISENQNKINLSGSLSWWSYGEKIIVEFIKGNNGINQFNISSRPKLKTTMVDYGKNRENVEKIEQLILKTTS